MTYSLAVSQMEHQPRGAVHWAAAPPSVSGGCRRQLRQFINGARVQRNARKSEAEALDHLSTLEGRLRSASAARVHAVSILEAGPHQCRFIVDDGIVPALCCGALTPAASSWCEEHLRVVFTPEGLRSQRGRLRVRTH
jgi:hypothetical protein